MHMTPPTSPDRMRRLVYSAHRFWVSRTPGFGRRTSNSYDARPATITAPMLRPADVREVSRRDPGRGDARVLRRRPPHRGRGPVPDLVAPRQRKRRPSHRRLCPCWCRGKARSRRRCRAGPRCSRCPRGRSARRERRPLTLIRSAGVGTADEAVAASPGPVGLAVARRPRAGRLRPRRPALSLPPWGSATGQHHHDHVGLAEIVHAHRLEVGQLLDHDRLEAGGEFIK